MLYKIVRPLATLALRLAYKKIYFTNAAAVPTDKPVILAVNHPTIFLEPCLLACFLPRPLHFLARGNLFKKPIYRKMLTSLNLIPIFRLKDGGYEKLKNNFSTFDYCFKALSENKAILIMAEGNCIQEKRLRPIRKGPARLAFGTFEEYGDLDIQVIPVGVNYTYPDHWRSEVMFEFGEPIKVSEYKKQYEADPNEAIRQFNEQLKMALEKLIIIIENPKDEALTEQFFKIDRNNKIRPIFPVFSKENIRLQTERKIANTVNQMTEENKSNWSDRATLYFSKLSKNKLTDFSIAQSRYYSFDRSLILVIGFFPFLMGYIGNYLPVLAAELLGKPVKDIEDRQAIVIASAIGTFLVYYLILIGIGFYLKSTFYWIILIMLPVWGYFSLLYQELFEKWNAARKVQKVDAKQLEELKAERLILSNLS